jgi:16S rRNA processing protein RimM
MIRVAKIVNTHALKGECKLYLYTDEIKERFAKGSVLYLKDGKELKVKAFRVQKNLGYAFFEGINHINDAEPLKGYELFVKEEELPQLDEDEFYYHQLIGCDVYNQNQEKLGVVSELLETGANLVLRVSHEEESFLLPFVKAFVLDVNIADKKITIQEMEGLR